MPYTYKYPRPALTVDCLIFSGNRGAYSVLLIKRGNPPFQGMWALPGGFVDIEETLVESASRELKEETGLDNITLHQLYTFDAPDRDPRHRTISVAFYGFVRKEEVRDIAGDDADDTRWFSLEDLPELAFDHEHVIHTAMEKLPGLK